MMQVCNYDISQSERLACSWLPLTSTWPLTSSARLYTNFCTSLTLLSGSSALSVPMTNPGSLNSGTFKKQHTIRGDIKRRKSITRFHQNSFACHFLFDTLKYVVIFNQTTQSRRSRNLNQVKRVKRIFLKFNFSHGLMVTFKYFWVTYFQKCKI